MDHPGWEEVNRPGVTRKDVERAMSSDRRVARFEVRYFGRDEPVVYSTISQINFDSVRKVTLVFPEGSGPWIEVGNGDAAVIDRKKVRSR